MNLRICVATVALCTLTAVPAVRANTVTFTEIPQEAYGVVWVEDGITVDPGGGFGGLGYHQLPHTLHLDDSGTGFASFASFTMGSRFNARSFDIIPAGPTAYCTDLDWTVCGAPYDNVQVSGFRGGIEVAGDKFFMGADPSTFYFSDLFRHLDSLVIAALYPNLRVIGGDCHDSPCAHFNIDNVTLNPVPVPAALPLFLSTLFGLGWFGWRRKQLVPA